MVVFNKIFTLNERLRSWGHYKELTIHKTFIFNGVLLIKMGLLKRIEIHNFECFRENTLIDLEDATFLIGENNSGKSSILRALCLFFNELEFKLYHLNKTELKRKQAWSRTTTISIIFDLSCLKLNAFKNRLIKFNKKQNLLKITAKFTYKADYPEEEFEILGKSNIYENLEPDIQKLIESVKINYIHPQEGTELLEKAQKKLQKRLLDNWGRSTVISKELNELENKWRKYRSDANKYLSSMLTENIKRTLGKGIVNVNLPESIKDVIKISEITFQADETLPEIQLTSQGTGIQQSLLYYASYLLDSDRTLRRNQEYHPVWLLEEPESFLHADMIIKLAKDLTSNEWLNNIQLLTTTHSGLLLSSSINSQSKILWNILSNHKLTDSYEPVNIDEGKVNKIGKLMGDPNFDVYFYSNISKVFIEDKQPLLISLLANNQINAKGLGGISEVHRYLKAFDVNSSGEIGKIMRGKFIIDGDKGKKDCRDYLKDDYKKNEKEGFTQYVHPNGSVIIVLPDGQSSERLIDEFPEYLNSLAHTICNEDLTLKSSIPNALAEVCGNLRRKFLNNPISSWDEVETELEKNDTVKHLFWKEVKDKNYELSAEKVKILKELLN